MMHSIGPEDSPRIRITRHQHPWLANFYRDHLQVFVGHAVPPSKDSDWPPAEECVSEGWKLGFTADEIRPSA